MTNEQVPASQMSETCRLLCGAEIRISSTSKLLENQGCTPIDMVPLCGQLTLQIRMSNHKAVNSSEREERSFFMQRRTSCQILDSSSPAVSVCPSTMRSSPPHSVLCPHWISLQTSSFHRHGATAIHVPYMRSEVGEEGIIISSAYPRLASLG